MDLLKSIEYCTKEDTRISGPWEFGVRPTAGGDPFYKARKALELTEDELLELKPHEYLMATKIIKVHAERS